VTVLDAPEVESASFPAPAAGGAAAFAVLSFSEPMPGFPRFRDYALVAALVAADGSGSVSWLQAVDPDGPRFLVIPAAVFFPDYAPTLPGAVVAELELGDPGEARLYCVVTVPSGDVSAATANLRAPVVVNPTTGRAQQVVLTDGVHPIRRPLRR
jgi:flagellar assembly factor FliW